MTTTTDQIMTTSRARQQLYKLVEAVSQHGRQVALTHRGEIAAVLVNPEELDSWMETALIQSDALAVKRIRQGEAAIKRGETVNLDALKKISG